MNKYIGQNLSVKCVDWCYINNLVTAYVSVNVAVSWDRVDLQCLFSIDGWESVCRVPIRSSVNCNCRLCALFNRLS